MIKTSEAPFAFRWVSDRGVLVGRRRLLTERHLNVCDTMPPEQPEHFAYCSMVIRDMLENVAADNGVKGSVG
jgi:hypothetical protein